MKQHPSGRPIVDYSERRLPIMRIPQVGPLTPRLGPGYTTYAIGFRAQIVAADNE